MMRRRAGITTTAAHRAKIAPADPLHGEARQMLLRQPPVHRRRPPKPGPPVHRAEAAHRPAPVIMRESMRRIHRMPPPSVKSGRPLVPRETRDDSPCFGGGKSFGERSWLAGVARSAPDAPGARRVVLRENDFPGIRKGDVGAEIDFGDAARMRCGRHAGRGGGQKAETPIVASTCGSPHALDLGDLSARQCGSDRRKKAASTLRCRSRL